jgi:hypothetical protein
MRWSFGEGSLNERKYLMTTTRSRFRLTGLASLSVLVASVGAAGLVLTARSYSQVAPGQQPAKAKIYVTKSAIETPTENLVAASASTAFANPKVEPGKVRWHGDFATARSAAARSGKPVLLFQMMGRLDEQFC